MNNTFAIALTTFRELIRSKVLYLAFFFVIILVVISSLFGNVTIGDQSRVVKDFGLFSISLCLVGFSVIAGSTLLAKELTKKTIYNILAKPVDRSQFIYGKYIGMCLTSALMLLLMGGGLSIFAACIEGTFDVLMLQAYLYMYLEIIIVCAVAILFSSVVVTPLLSGMFSFGLFLVGRSVSYLLYFVSQESTSPTLAKLLKFLYWVTPNLDSLNIANEIVYGKALSGDHMLFACIYTFGYATVLLLVAQFFFKRKEFN